MCAQTGVMLVAGGLLDQPYKRTQTMLTAKNVFDVFRLYSNFPEGDVAFSRAHPEAWGVVTAMDKWIRSDG